MVALPARGFEDQGAAEDGRGRIQTLSSLHAWSPTAMGLGGGRWSGSAGTWTPSAAVLVGSPAEGLGTQFDILKEVVITTTLSQYVY